MMLNKYKSQGFSLVEMMVVVTILAIIAGIAIPNYMSYVENTRLAQARAVITQVQQDIQRVKLVEGSLGADSAAIVARVEGVLNGIKAQGLISENNLTDYYGFSVEAGSGLDQYFFNITPINASKKGLYMDQSGNTFKCPNAAGVSSHSGCETM